FFFFQAEDGIRDRNVTGVQTCALPIFTIYNGRLSRYGFSLEREGFVLVKHETKVANFYDEEEVRSVYYPEIERLVKEMTGAAKVLIFDHTLRAADDATREQKQVGAPVRNVHNDYTEWSGPQRVRDLLPADEAAEDRKSVV